MNKVILTGFSLLILLNSTAWAVENNPINDTIESIYCPQEIKCTTSGQVDSCKIEYISDSDYFGKLTGSPTSSEVMKFVSITAGFHSNSSIAMCRYGSTKTNASLILPVKPQANLEAYYQPESQWNFDSNGANCQTSSSKSCPLKERLGFVIYNFNVTGGVIAASNGTDISDLIPSSKTIGVTFDDALAGCGNITECTIDLLSSKSVKYGSIRINLDNMKILEIMPVYPSKIQIKKIEPFNSIEISYPLF